MVWGLGFGVVRLWGSRFGFDGLGFGVEGWGLGFWGWSLRFGVLVLGRRNHRGHTRAGEDLHALDKLRRRLFCEKQSP